VKSKKEINVLNFVGFLNLIRIFLTQIELSGRNIRWVMVTQAEKKEYRHLF